MQEICDDLAAEHAALDDVVAPLDDDGWDTPTPAEGWTVRDQIAHLAFFDSAAITSATDPERFAEDTAAAMVEPAAFMDSTLVRGRGMSGQDLLAWWRDGRAEMLEVFRALDPRARLPWYGPPMGARSFATARLMETWAHGQDVCDALDVQREPTARLRHIAHIGVRARPFSYVAHGREMPDADVRVELTAPDGEVWSWGDEAAPERVTGPALDFCLVVTQRRHVSDTDLAVDGPLAEDWIAIAQAFAGPPGAGRRPGQFPRRA